MNQLKLVSQKYYRVRLCYICCTEVLLLTGEIPSSNSRRIPDYAVVPIMGYPVERTVHEIVTNAWLVSNTLKQQQFQQLFFYCLLCFYLPVCTFIFIFSKFLWNKV